MYPAREQETPLAHTALTHTHTHIHTHTQTQTKAHARIGSSSGLCALLPLSRVRGALGAKQRAFEGGTHKAASSRGAKLPRAAAGAAVPGAAAGGRSGPGEARAGAAVGPRRYPSPPAPRCAPRGGARAARPRGRRGSSSSPCVSSDSFTPPPPPPLSVWVGERIFFFSSSFPKAKRDGSGTRAHTFPSRTRTRAPTLLSHPFSLHPGGEGFSGRNSLSATNRETLGSRGAHLGHFPHFPRR